jgi:carboxymethylenebutenolidase
MCHSADSRPPPAAEAGAIVRGRGLTLEEAGGNRFAAYAARALEPRGRGVVILPDVRGLHPYYCVLAERFAEIGVDATAIDYYGRTAGISRRDEDFAFRPHFEQTTAAGVAADAAAAAGFLRSPAGGGVLSVFAVGFCFGGSAAWRLAAELPELTGAIGFYGHPHRAIDLVKDMRAPLLMIAAGDDASIPPGEIVALAQAVRDAGGAAEAVVYDGCPHSFFDRDRGDCRAACDDAWMRIRQFIEAQSALVEARI